jgi:alanine racemase
MAKPKTVYNCTECGGQSLKWQGQCPHCNAWNSMVEGVAEPAAGKGGAHRFASLAGARTQTAGRVSMDMITVDLSPVPSAQVGSPVVLWGDGMAVDEVAIAAGTVGYELLCGITPRVPIVEAP